MLRQTFLPYLLALVDPELLPARPETGVSSSVLYLQGKCSAVSFMVPLGRRSNSALLNDAHLRSEGSLLSSDEVRCIFLPPKRTNIINVFSTAATAVTSAAPASPTPSQRVLRQKLQRNRVLQSNPALLSLMSHNSSGLTRAATDQAAVAPMQLPASEPPALHENRQPSPSPPPLASPQREPATMQSLDSGGSGGGLMPDAGTPSKSPSPPEVAMMRAAPAPNRLSAPDGSNIRALVVDDIRINQRILVNLLDKLGIECATASSGPEALQLASRTRFDIMMLDICMPGMDGFNLALILRNEERRHRRRCDDGGDADEASVQQQPLPPTPIMAVTATVEQADVQKCLELVSMNGFLPKPFQLARLADTIKNVLTLHPPVRPLPSPVEPHVIGPTPIANLVNVADETDLAKIAQQIELLTQQYPLIKAGLQTAT